MDLITRARIHRSALRPYVPLGGFIHTTFPGSSWLRGLLLQLYHCACFSFTLRSCFKAVVCRAGRLKQAWGQRYQGLGASTEHPLCGR